MAHVRVEGLGLRISGFGDASWGSCRLSKERVLDSCAHKSVSQNWGTFLDAFS